MRFARLRNAKNNANSSSIFLAVIPSEAGTAINQPSRTFRVSTHYQTEGWDRRFLLDKVQAELAHVNWKK
jgi:hypothetical protein